MTLEEEKYLLLGDLCARLPYGVIGKCEVDASYDTSFDTIFQYHRFNAELNGINGDLVFVTPLIDDKDELEYTYEEVADGIDIFEFKPYLRPMSSMTEEEEVELGKLIGKASYNMMYNVDFHDLYILLEFIYKKHLDYNHLIEKDLALEAPEEMY